MELFGEYEGIKLGTFENSFDGTKDNEDEVLLIGFIKGSPNGIAEEKVVGILLGV